MRTSVIVALTGLAIALSMVAVFKSILQPQIEATGADGECKSEMTEIIAPECACIDASTSRVQDFCYSLPSNASLRGKRFSCDWLSHASELRVLQSDYSSGVYNNMANSSEFPLPAVFVTAASENHFGEAVRLLGNLQSQFAQPKIIFYDLGLALDSATKVKKLCNVEYRPFRFDKYPSYVGNLFEYRWKPIIIAETLAEFKMIWWLDSSIVFTNATSTRSVYGLLGSFAGNQIPRDASSSLENPPRLIGEYDGCDTASLKFPFLLHVATGYSIFATTHKGLYDYLPGKSLEFFQSQKAQMFGANLALIVRTQHVVDGILKWWLLCALEKDCMAPQGHFLYCSAGQSTYTDYAGCHRYDQSALNLLLANRLGYFQRWSSGMDDFYDVLRGATLGYIQPRSC